MLAAVRRGGQVKNASTRVAVTGEDIRYHQRRGKSPYLVLFIIDASGSMAGRQRIEWARQAMLSLLADAYRERDRVALIALANGQAELLLAPTRSTDLAARQLRELRTGGRTALSAGLSLAAETLERALHRDPLQAPYVVCVTDGRVNQSLETGAAPVPEALEIARRFRASFNVPGLIVDSEEGFVRLGIAKDIAASLGAGYRRIEEFTGATISASLRNEITHAERGIGNER
jgi:magnesium chelatase subunit D